MRNGSIVPAVLLFIVLMAPVSECEQSGKKNDIGISGIRGGIVVTVSSLAAALYTGIMMADSWEECDLAAENAWIAASDSASIDYTEIRSLTEDSLNAWKQGNVWRNYCVVSTAALTVSYYLLYKSIKDWSRASDSNKLKTTHRINEAADHGAVPWVKIKPFDEPGSIAVGINFRF